MTRAALEVRIYPGGAVAAVGDRRFEVEWHTVGPRAAKRIAEAEARGDEAEAEAEVDFDRDLITHTRHYTTREAATRAARGIVNLGRTFFGTATVTEETVEIIDGAVGVGEWIPVGDADHVD